MSVLAGTRAGNESALACNLVDQVVGQQKIQRTVHRRWYRALIARLQPIEELIGGNRHLGLNDESQHRAPQGGELGTAACQASAATSNLFSTLDSSIGSRILTDITLSTSEDDMI